MNNKNLTLRQKFISLNLRHKLVLLVFFCSIVPLSIMGGVTFFMMKVQMEQSLSDLLEETGRSTARLMDNYLLQRRVDLGLVSGSSTLRAGHDTQALFGLNRYIETFDDFDALLFADTRGNLVASAGNVLRTQGDANADQMVSSWVQEARQGATVLDRVTPQPGNISRYVVFIQPVRYQGIDYGWVFGQVDSEKIANISITVEIGETGRATLFNREGFLIGHQDKARYGSDLSQYPIMKNPVQRGIGNTGELFLSSDGRIKWGMTLMLSQSLEQLGLQWGIIVDQTEAELYAPVTFLNKVLWALWVVALIFTLILGLIYSSYITGPLRKLVSRLNNISSSEADLTQRLEVHSRDEVGQTAEAFNNVMHKLQMLITQVSDQTVGLARSSEHISKMAKATGKAIDQEQQEIEQVATAMNEMSATVQEVASNTLQAADAARKVVGEVKNGNQLVNSTAAVNKKLSEDLDDATQVINNLKDDSDNIGTILQVIHNIADQTNLLALNAAIEAARAGEQGRGFAVVADEVRTLAKRSNDATVEIQQIIEQLQTRADEAVSAMRVSRDRAEEGVDQSARAGQALGVISQAIDDINDMDHQIASATEEQSLVAEEINRSIHKVSKVADETAQQTSSMLEEINSIDQLAKQLKGIVAQFRI